MPSVLDALVEHIPLPTYVFQVVGTDYVLCATSAACRARNPGITAFLGRPLQGLYRDQPQTIADAERCIAEQTTVVREMVVRRYDQTEGTQTLRLTYVPVPPDYLVLMLEDVSTEDVQAATLRESEARYRSLVSSLPDAVILRGKDGRVLACNDVAVKLFGQKSQADVLGQHHVLAAGFRVTTEEGEFLADETFPSRRVIQTGDAELGQTYGLVGGGRTRWLRVSAQPIVSTSGEAVGSVGIFTDVSEQRRLSAELMRVGRLESIGRLAGGVAHDFNNLLAAMMGSIELLSPHVPAGGKEDLATIRLAAERARDLTRKLLAFARLQPLEFKVVDLAKMVDELGRLLRRLVGPDVDLRMDVLPTFVRADQSLLEQVLVNLVVNAKEAMPNGGLVRIAVYGSATDGSGRPADTAVLEVTDTGVGMSDETKAKVFDPFFTTKAYGTGLGLASSYGIVQQHGGDFVVESGIGEGTRFKVLLPRAEAAPSVEKPASLAPAPAPTGVALAVDDEAMVLATTVRVLRHLGYDVLSATNGEEALELSRAYAGSIDVLVTDVVMPGIDGPSLAGALLRERPTLRVLFVSGYADKAHTSPDTDATHAAFLQKPFGIPELTRKLAALRR